MPSNAQIDRYLAALEAADLKDSFRDFFRESWQCINPSTPFVGNWHLDAISDHLQAVEEGKIRQLVINIPPRCSKSTQASVAWPAWCWARNPAKRFLFASYAESLSKRDSRFCRELVSSQWYRERWPDVRFKSDQNQQMRYETTAQGVRLAVTVGGMNAGEGGDIIVVDDPHNFMEIYSQAYMERAIHWWSTAMSTRGNDPSTCARVIIMQRVHMQDLCGVLKEEGDWEWLILPMEYNPKIQIETSLHAKDPRTEEGELLWPERFPASEVAKIKKRLGTHNASAQLGQMPSPMGGNIIQEDWLMRYDKLPEDTTSWMLSWDCSFKDLDVSSYVVGTVWARKGGNFYLVDLIRRRMDIVATLAAIERMSKQWPQAAKKLVEDKANGPAIIRLLKGRIPGIIAWPRKGKKMPSKESRLFAVAPTFEAGNVWIPRQAPWVDEYVEELTTFPQSKHNDQVDSTSMALLEYTQGPRIILESDLPNEAD